MFFSKMEYNQGFIDIYLELERTDIDFIPQDIRETGKNIRPFSKEDFFRLKTLMSNEFVEGVKFKGRTDNVLNYESIIILSEYIKTKHKNKKVILCSDLGFKSFLDNTLYKKDFIDEYWRFTTNNTTEIYDVKASLKCGESVIKEILS